MNKVLLFDWGNTVMVDFVLPGPMCSWEKVDWVDGAEEAIEALSHKYKCYLATNAGASTEMEVKLALHRVLADRFFTGIFLAKEIGYEKPDFRFFKAIIDKMGILPENFIMIGDNYFKDCEGAKKAGMRTVLFNATGIIGTFPMADAVISSMNELANVIETL